MLCLFVFVRVGVLCGCDQMYQSRRYAINDSDMRQVLTCDGTHPHDIRSVHVTIDPSRQTILDAACRRASADIEVEAVAGVIIRTSTGEVVAESSQSGGRDAHYSPAFDGAIQPGSVIKPFVLLEALERGVSIDTHLESKPFVWRSRTLSSGMWSVRNYNHIYRGEITLSDALVLSDNTVFARLTQALGVESIAARLAEFGLVDASVRNPSVVLGAVRGGISLVRICKAFAALAHGGALHEPHLVRGIEFSDGSLIPR